MLSIEHRLLLPDGCVRWVTTNARTFFEEDRGGHTFGRRVGTILDITDRKEAEARLRASEERYALFERGVNDGIWDWDIQTGEHYHSPRWKELVGSRDDAVPNTESSFFDRLHPEDVADGRRGPSASLRGGRAVRRRGPAPPSRRRLPVGALARRSRPGRRRPARPHGGRPHRHPEPQGGRGAAPGQRRALCALRAWRERRGLGLEHPDRRALPVAAMEGDCRLQETMRCPTPSRRSSIVSTPTIRRRCPRRSAVIMKRAPATRSRSGCGIAMAATGGSCRAVKPCETQRAVPYGWSARSLTSRTARPLKTPSARPTRSSKPASSTAPGPCAKANGRSALSAPAC